MIKKNGFTLVELMVVVAIVAIMAILAFPSFSQQILQDRIVSSANQLNSVYKYARSEAVKRERDVRLVASGTTWQVKAFEDGSEKVLREFIIEHQGISVGLVDRTVWSSGEISAEATMLIADTNSNTKDYYLCILKSGQNWLAEKSVGCG